MFSLEEMVEVFTFRVQLSGGSDRLNCGVQIINLELVGN